MSKCNPPPHTTTNTTKEYDYYDKDQAYNNTYSHNATKNPTSWIPLVILILFIYIYIFFYLFL